MSKDIYIYLGTSNHPFRNRKCRIKWYFTHNPEYCMVYFIDLTKEEKDLHPVFEGVHISNLKKITSQT